jgi:hypothetical protein
MTERSLIDYGRDMFGTPIRPRFAMGAFAKDCAVDAGADEGDDAPAQMSFQHWSMYDYFRAVITFAGGTWNDSNGACHLLGIREMDTAYRRQARIQGEWNDLIVVVREGSPPKIYTFEATIDPGGTLGRDPHPDGQLILAPGVHRARLGTGKHDKVHGPVMVLTDFTFCRDSDRDGHPDTQEDWRVRRSGEAQGEHIHWSRPDAVRVGGWSTGCSVIHNSRTSAEYVEFIQLMRQHHAEFGQIVGLTELDVKSPDPDTARAASLDEAPYDIEYVVTSTAHFRTPAEILALPTFYSLFEHVKRPTSDLPQR